MAALPVAYNIATRGRYQGPFPEAMTLGNNSRMRIQFDAAIRCQRVNAFAFQVGRFVFSCWNIDWVPYTVASGPRTVSSGFRLRETKRKSETASLFWCRFVFVLSCQMLKHELG